MTLHKFTRFSLFQSEKWVTGGACLPRKPPNCKVRKNHIISMLTRFFKRNKQHSNIGRVDAGQP